METTQEHRPRRKRDPIPGAEAPPESSGEALERARGHARRATAEALAGVQAVLDAAALATSGVPSEIHTLLGPLAVLLSGLEDRLVRSAGPMSAPIVHAITDALDAEISRWETRAQDDPEARAVLRAFLGLRELLWEFGLRRDRGGVHDDPGGNESEAGRGPRVKRSRRPRVQRVTVEG